MKLESQGKVIEMSFREDELVSVYDVLKSRPDLEPRLEDLMRKIGRRLFWLTGDNRFRTYGAKVVG